MNNDSISREALIKWIDDSVSQHGNTYSTDMLNMWGLFKDYLINNAPTVPLPDFKEGYKQAILDGKTNFSRPEGKWGKTFDRNGKTYHKCNRCHVSSELTLFDNFCPFCGADMREVKKNDRRNE